MSEEKSSKDLREDVINQAISSIEKKIWQRRYYVLISRCFNC